MTMKEYMPYIVSVFCALIAAIASIRIAAKNAKNDNKRLISEYSLKKGQHMSQVKFDHIYGIYKSLAEKTGVLIGKTGLLFPTFSSVDYTEEGKKNLYFAAVDSYNEAQIEWMRAAPFLEKTEADRFANLYKDARMLIDSYREFELQSKQQRYQEDEMHAKESRECFKSTRKLNSDYELLVDELRKKIQDLDI